MVWSWKCQNTLSDNTHALGGGGEATWFTGGLNNRGWGDLDHQHKYVKRDPLKPVWVFKSVTGTPKLGGGGGGGGGGGKEGQPPLLPFTRRGKGGGKDALSI